MNRTFAGVEVRQRQFGVDNFNIISRVNFAGNVNDVVIFKAANNVTDRFSFTDVGQELVTQTFAFDAPFTRPAISTNSMVVGSVRCGFTISAS